MASKLKGLPGIKNTELVPSSGGVFEIKVDGELVFSKLQEKRFPNEGEIEAKLLKMAD